MYAEIVKTVIKGAGKTMDAFANKASNDSALTALEAVHQNNLISINNQSAFARASLAVRGVRQGNNQIKNDANQKTWEAMRSYAISRKQIKDSTTMGFVSAVLGTSSDAIQASNNIQQQKSQEQQTQLFKQRLQQTESRQAKQVNKLEGAADQADPSFFGMGE
tara:strand:+ start:1694 stop:2182 length:489 start_codon:yes stop_codon:yes gene_type:complete